MIILLKIISIGFLIAVILYPIYFFFSFSTKYLCRKFNQEEINEILEKMKKIREEQKIASMQDFRIHGIKYNFHERAEKLAKNYLHIKEIDDLLKEIDQNTFYPLI